MNITRIMGPQFNVQRNTPASPTSPSAPPTSNETVELKGSNCPRLDECQKADPFESQNNEPFQVSVILKRPKELNFQPGPLKRLTRQDMARFGATPKQLESVKAFAKENGLTVTGFNPTTRIATLKGNARQYEKAFGVHLGQYKDAKGNEFRAHDGNIKLPKDLAGQVDGVLGLNTRAVARPHFTGLKPKRDDSVYTPDQVAKMYNFPQGTDGSGQTIAIIELGGGYNDQDLDAYFKKLGIPKPDIQSISVDGATNSPTGDPNGPDGEVALDIEVAGAAAPGAKIRVYFAPNTDQGFLNAVNAAAKDNPNAISISWGGPEDRWSSQAANAMNNALKDAAAQGINVFVSAGDDLSTDGEQDGKNHVDFPASSPFAISSGGTSIQTANGQITHESVWNGGDGSGTGGGFSDIFDRPDWQSRIVPNAPSGKPMRGTPDISADADPGTGYDVMVDGAEGAIGGTSAVSPLLAALSARLGQAMGAPLGYLNPLLYTDQFTNDFNDITDGNNGAFQAGPGWDAASGLGTPDGEKILATLKSLQSKSGGPVASTPAPAANPLTALRGPRRPAVSVVA